MSNTYHKPVLSAEVYSRLASMRLADAFEVVRRDVVRGEHRDLLPEVDRLLQTYRAMLDYLVTGGPDDDRESMLDEIRSGLRDIAQELDRRATMVDDGRLYYSTARLLELRRVDLGAALRSARELGAMVSLAEMAGSLDSGLLRKKEEAYELVFNRLWTLGRETDAAVASLPSLINDRDTPFDLTCIVISALMLGLLQYYDSKRIQVLLDAYENCSDEIVAARLLTSIVLVVRRWSERIRSDRKVMLRLEALRDSLVSYRRLREIFLALIRTRDTERVTAKMRDEVIPDLMKVNPELMARLRESVSENPDTGIEGNPEWEEILEKSGLSEKMQELNELQNQGADMMMMAFSNLKSFPFFRTMTNWFIPFSLSHSSIADYDWAESDALRNLIESRGMMCDSDKFSLIFAFNAMPAAQRDMMLRQIEAQIAQFGEMMEERRLKSASPDFDAEVTRYLRDLYRFYRLYSRHSDFADPFRKSFVFTDLPVIGDLLAEPEVLRLVGEFYFRRGYHDNALPMLRRLAEEDGDDASLWEKTGYCLEATGDFNGAVECYVKAELFNPDKLWTVRRLGEVYFKSGRMREALTYLRRVAESEPDNIKALLALADAEQALGHTDEVLKSLYKADYLSPDNRDIWLRIVQAEVASSNPEKAEKYMARLLANAPLRSDYMLAGHLALASRDLRQAASLYRQSMDPKAPLSQWREEMSRSTESLPSGFIDPATMYLLMDKVEFDTQS